ncbi:MAG TPA: hypothetical protein VLC28_07690 [Flavitalea sp.]|nr:hypothetical protein [Flavitalea sp.]
MLNIEQVVHHGYSNGKPKFVSSGQIEDGKTILGYGRLAGKLVGIDRI